MRLLLLAVPVLLVLPACSDAVDTATKAKDCAGLARDVAASGLQRTPTRAEAERAAEQLRQRADEADSEEVRDAASDLAARLDELRAALAGTDRAKAEAAAARARDAARAAAETCGIPVGQFLPGS